MNIIKFISILAWLGAIYAILALIATAISEKEYNEPLNPRRMRDISVGKRVTFVYKQNMLIFIISLAWILAN